MSYTYEDIRRIFIRLDKVTGLEGIKVLFARDRTLKNMKSLYESTDPETVIPLSQGFKDYEGELRKIYEKFATVDGQVKTKNSLVDGYPQETLDFNPNDPELKKAKAKLDAKHKDDIEFRKEQEQKYRDFLKTTVDEKKDPIKIFYIPLNLAPTDQFKFEALSPLIRDMDPEKEAEWETLFAGMME
jgi:hypothetical protein